MFDDMSVPLSTKFIQKCQDIEKVMKVVGQKSGVKVIWTDGKPVMTGSWQEIAEAQKLLQNHQVS